MRISDLIKMGLKNLTRRKARTILTISGVVVGSLLIIIMRSIGHGLDYNFTTQVKQYGSLTTITIEQYGAIYDEDGNWAGSKEQQLSDDLVKQVKALDHVRAVSPVIRQDAQLFSGKYQGYAYITAMDSSVFDDFEFPELTKGEYPSEKDKSMIIFGYMQPWEFYDPTSRMWQSKTIDLDKDKIVLKFRNYMPDPKKREFSLPLKNIAKMAETKSDFDYNTYMDLEYFKSIYTKYCNTLSLKDRKNALKNLENYQQIMLNVDNIDNVEAVQDKIKEMGFQSYSMLKDIRPMIEASRTLQMVLLALGAVSMFVSAISIANTMVMAIYERTKEIGIMKVLGCQIRHIRMLFLFESGLIGFIGGLVGVILGYVASFLINRYGQPLFGQLMSGSYMYDMTNTKFSIIPFYLPFMAMGISIGVGLIFGYFPARRATKIRAIEAMKNEN